VRQFDARDLVQTLAKIDHMVHEDYLNPHTDRESWLLRRFLPPIWYKKAELWLNTRRRTKAFHRVLVPAAIQLAFLESDANTASVPVKDHRTRFGELLLHISTVLDADAKTHAAPSTEWKPHHRMLCAHMTRLHFFSQVDDFGAWLGRFKLLVTHGLEAVRRKVPGEHFDFEASFEAALGFSYPQFVAHVIGLKAHYDALTQRLENSEHPSPREFLIGPNYFASITDPNVARTSPLILRQLGLSWNDHVAAMKARVKETPESLLQFSTIYDYPLLEVTSDTFFPLDMIFLEAAASDGAYWKHFNRLLADNDHSSAYQLRGAIGRAVEWHVCELLRRAFPPSTEHQLFLDWDDSIPHISNVPTPDAIIVEDETMCVLEITASALRPLDATSCDPDRIEHALAEVWFGRGHHRESPKLLQLSNAIDAFRNGTLPLTGVSHKQVKRIVPILVTYRRLAQDHLLHHWYDLLMQENGLSTEFRDQLVFLSVSEVEQLASLKEEGKSWASIISAKQSWTHPHTTMNNFLIESGIAPKRHARLNEAMNAVFEDSTQLLFQKPYRGPSH
jgi:hypothetical protein